MALARKCDRCGKYYDYYYEGSNAIRALSKDEKGTIIREECTIDLCQDCMVEFNLFMTKVLICEDECE